LSQTRAATRTAASPQYGDVSAAVALAQSGDTVQVPAGTATWSSTLNLGSKAITLQGAGSDKTIITNTVGCLIRWNGTGDTLTRLTGFTINSSDNMNVIVHMAGPATKFRVDNCVMNKGDTAVSTNDFRVQTGTGPVYGVVDHCSFYNFKRPVYPMDNRVGDSTTNGSYTKAWNEFLAAPGSYPGSGKMMFFEDNRYIWNSNNTDNNTQGAMYGGYSGKACFRYNVVTGTDYKIDAHGGLGDSTIYYEIYNNNFSGPTYFAGAQGFSCWQRGGRWIAHDNDFNNANFPFFMSVYFTYDTPIMWVQNSYFWNNRWNGGTDQSKMVAVRDSGQTPAGFSAANIKLNQQYFLRPPQSGELFYPYSPYVYPHPLVTGNAAPAPAPGGSATPTPTPAPSATPSGSPTPLGLSFPSTSGNLSAPFAANSDSTVSQSVETTDPTQGGEAVYTFDVASDGAYIISALVSCPDDSSNSFFINVDGEPTTAMIWSAPLTSGLESKTVSWAANLVPQVFNLSAGTHQLFIRGREAGAKIGQITISAALSPPTNLRVAGP